MKHLMYPKKTLLPLFFTGFFSALAAEDVTICSTGGTNDPYTAENPLVCRNFLYQGSSYGTTAGYRTGSLASFTSGIHWIYGTLTTPGDRTYCYSKTAELQISGPDTVVTASNVVIKSVINSTPYDRTVDGVPFKTVFSITDGAKLVSSNDFSVVPGSFHVPYVILDNATVECVEGAFHFSSVNTTNTAYLYAKDSVISTPKKSIKFGRLDNYGGPSSQVVACTNVTFHTAGIDMRWGGLTGEFVDCCFPSDGENDWYFYLNSGAAADSVGRSVLDVTFKNCSIPFAASEGTGSGYAGTAGRMPHVTFDGGSVNFTRWAIGGNTSSATARFTLTNNVDITLAFGNFTIGNYATGRLDIAGTRLVVSNNLYLGKTPNAKTEPSAAAILNIYDGASVEVDFTAASSPAPGDGQCYVGCGASSYVTVYGGALSARNFLIGSSTYNYECFENTQYVLHQLGGVVTNGYDASFGTVVAQYKKARAKLILEGGEFRTARIYGGEGYSTFSANGGKVIANISNPTGGFLHGLTEATVGPKGLTLEVPSGRDGIVLTQAIGNQEGESGLFVKTGAGALRFAPEAWTVSNTVVRAGTLEITSAELTLQTHLSIEEGAVLSLQDGQANVLTLDGLTLDGGTLLLDPDDRIVVTGRTDIRNLSLSLSSLPETGVPCDLIQSAVLTERSVQAFRSALAGADIPEYGEGRYGKFNFVSGEGGSMSVTFTVNERSDPLSGEALTTWQGATADGWSDPASWSAGVPETGKKAVFPASTGVNTVEIPEGAAATAVSFGGDYTLSGNKLIMSGNRGALEMESTAGETLVSVPVELDDVASVPVASGSVLKIEGSVSAGGLKKTGKGRLELSGENTTALDIVHGGGVLSVTEGALGVSPVTLAADTFETVSDGAPVVFSNRFVVETATPSNAVVFKADVPTVINCFDHIQGGFLKRGINPLTMLCADGDSLIASKASKQLDAQGWFELAEDGTAPSNFELSLFSAFSVMEGEVVLRARPGEVNPVVSANKDHIDIGLRHTNGTVRARLTLDGVTLDNTGNYTFLGGFNSGNDSIGSGMKVKLVPELLKSELCMTNGATLKVSTFRSASYGNNPEMRPLLAMTNSTINAGTFQFSFINTTPVKLQETANALFRLKNSVVTASSQFITMIKTDADFDGSLLAKSADGTPGKMQFTYGAAGTILFRNGAVCALGTLDFTGFRNTYPLAGEVMTLAFDDAEWRYGSGDYTFNPSIPNDASDGFAVEMRGKGVRLAPAAGTVFTTLFPFTGEGGLQVTGEGTVAFGAGALAFTGPIDAGEGTVDLSQAGELSGATFAAGRILGGTLKDVNIAFDADDDWSKDGGMPLFDGCTFGRVTVDCGRDASAALPIPLVTPVCVAEFTGTAPDVTRWRIGGTGVNGVWGKFTVSEGKVMMTASRLGFSVIIR